MSGVLDIDRLTATCVGPAGAAEGLAARVDGAMRNRFPEACRHAVSPLLDGPEGEVWFIRRLAVDVGVPDRPLDSHELARLLASTAGAAIAETIAAGPEGDRVIRFSSRAAYLSELLSDLAEGTAFDRWYHADAGGLALLPAGAAVREALARDAPAAEPALLKLAADGRLGPVLSVLSAGGARAALDTCLGALAGDPSPTPELIRALARAWAAAGLPTSGELATPPNALRLYLALRRESPGLAPSSAGREVLMAVLALGDIVRSAPDRTAAAGAISRGDMTEVARIAARCVPAAVPLLPTIAEASPGMLEPLVGAVRPAAPVAQRPETALETPFGGAFLLMAYAPWLRADSDPVRRFIPLAKALGGAEMALAAADPAMRLAVGAEDDTELLPPMAEVPAPPAPDQAEESPPPDDLAFLRAPSLTPDTDAAWSVRAHALLQAFADRQLGFGDSSAEFLNAQFLRGSSAVRLRDGRVEVDLPSAPLDVILRMSGVHGLTYELPWAGEVELRLPEG